MSFLRLVLRLSLFGLLGALWLLAGAYLYLSPNLPNVETLRDVRLQTPMMVYTREGELIGQFGEQKRSPLPFEAIPDQFIKALLAAEDDNYFVHRGIDLMGLMRAVSELVLTGEKGSGGSTLTMQVARNYFLSRDRTFIRKFNEILLAIEIERNLSKQEIFELYFNRIFLGHRAYGFEAAAQVYYGKGIGELNLAQHAMLGEALTDHGAQHLLGHTVGDGDHKLDEVEAGPCHAVVIVGRPGVFSAGLDLKLLPTLPPREIPGCRPFRSSRQRTRHP